MDRRVGDNMKRILILLILLVLLFSSPSFAGVVMMGGAGTTTEGPTTCAGSNTIIGYDSAPTIDADRSTGSYHWATQIGLAVPSGKTQICMLKAYVKYTTNANNVRIAVYSTKNSSPFTYSGLICEGTGEQVVASDSYAWLTWTYGGSGATGLTGTCAVTPGSTYYVVVTADGTTAETQIGVDTFTSDGVSYAAGDYTGTFSDPTATQTTSSGYLVVGIGVQ